MAAPHPYPGIPVKAPQVPPAPGQVIVSYMVVEPELGCCKCDDLNGLGLTLLIVGIILFWPIALIPCFSASMKNKHQVPVYGYPGGVPPMAYPQPGYAVPGVPQGYPPPQHEQPAKV